MVVLLLNKTYICVAILSSFVRSGTDNEALILKNRTVLFEVSKYVVKGPGPGWLGLSFPFDLEYNYVNGYVTFRN
jgi:hypothetical protein